MGDCRICHYCNGRVDADATLFFLGVYLFISDNVGWYGHVHYCQSLSRLSHDDIDIMYVSDHHELAVGKAAVFKIHGWFLSFVHRLGNVLFIMAPAHDAQQQSHMYFHVIHFLKNAAVSMINLSYQVKTCRLSVLNTIYGTCALQRT